MSALQAFLFGVTLAMTVGPIALLIMTTALQAGFRAGFSCAVGATVADLLCALLAFHGAQQLLPVLQARAWQFAAAMLLVLFAMHLLWRLFRQRAVELPVRRSHRYALDTFALTAVNPLSVLAFGSFAVQLAARGSTSSATLLAFAATAGTGSISVLMAVAATGLGRMLRHRRWLTGLNVASAFGILLFGLHGLWRLV